MPWVWQRLQKAASAKRPGAAPKSNPDKKKNRFITLHLEEEISSDNTPSCKS